MWGLGLDQASSTGPSSLQVPTSGLGVITQSQTSREAGHPGESRPCLPFPPEDPRAGASNLYLRSSRMPVVMV